MKVSKEDRQHAYEMLKEYRGCKVAANINRVSRSGMNRRIEFYVIKDNDIVRVGPWIAKICEYSYDIDKGGLSVSSYGMDMVFSVLSNLNYEMAKLDTGKTIQELREPQKLTPPDKNGVCRDITGYNVNGKFYQRIYDNYFFDANRYISL